MAHLIPTAKPPRRGTRYSREEIVLISRYKAEYKDQTTRPLRANVLRNKILVDLFNYWDVQKTLPLDETESMERVKELAAWVRNNWRPNANAAQSNPTMKIRAIDYVWETQREAVEEELKTLLGVDELDHKDPRCFQQRNAAAKLALQKMSVEEKTEIELDLETRRAEGNPEHIRRYRAERHRRKTLQTFSRERWLDMGMSTITFTVHIDQQGRYIGDMSVPIKKFNVRIQTDGDIRHEDVLHNVGIAGRNFSEQHEPIVIEMTRKFLEYAKAARLEAADPEIADRRHADSEPIEIRMTTDGFPIIPKLVMEKELKKGEWETLIRAFLTQHYYLASGQKPGHVPYGALKTDTAGFISAEYRPPGIIFQDPRNMHLDDIRRVLKHCYARQADSGPESAFRFSLFIGPKRKQLFALYPDGSHSAPKKSDKSRPKKKDKGKQREDALQGLLQIDELVEPPTADPGTVNQQSPTPTVAGPSDRTQFITEQQQAATSHQNDLVRIDMGQMLQLKEMGYEIMGPVNGPNEGYPEYEVSQAVLQVLMSNRQSHNPPTPIEAVIQPEPALTIFDPALLGQGDNNPHNTIVSPLTVPQPLEGASHTPSNVIVDLLHSSAMPRPTTPPNTEADPANIPTRPRTPITQLGKRAQANLSPPAVHQTRNAKKKKKVTDDDLAAMEAENMVEAGSKRKRKSTRRK